MAALPKGNTSAFKSFPHKKDEIKLQNVTIKLKAIRLKLRQAVDSGQKSGHGRVVMMYYELCEKEWGGSLCHTADNGGIQTSEFAAEAGNLDDT